VWNAKQLLERARDYLNDPEKNTWSDARLLRDLQAYAESLGLKAKLEGVKFNTFIEESAFAYADVTLQGSNRGWAYVDLARFTNIAKLWRTDSGQWQEIPWVNASAISSGSRSLDYDQLDEARSGMAYDLHGDRVMLYGSIPASLVCSIEYEKPVSRMAIATVSGAPVGALAVLASSIGTLSQINNYYTGADWQKSDGVGPVYHGVSSAAGVGNTVGVTMQETVGWADTDEVASMIDMPLDAMEVVALGGAVNAAIGRNDVELARLLGSMLVDRERIALQVLHDRESEYSREVHRE
jgi:hypothetical protein